jgi:hypothetical protein
LKSTEAIVILISRRRRRRRDLVLPKTVTTGSLDATVGGEYLVTGAALPRLRREKGHGRATDAVFLEDGRTN